MLRSDTKDFGSELPKPEKAKKDLKALRNLTLSEFEDKALERVIRRYIPIIPHYPAYLDEGAHIFKARLNTGQAPYNHVKEISIPPKKTVKNYGRANKPFSPIFYGAIDLELALFEVCQEYKKSINPKREAAFITVGHWKIKKGERLNLSSIYHSQDHIDARLELGKQHQESNEFLENGLIEKDKAKILQWYIEFFANEFSKEAVNKPEDYKISSFYAEGVKNMNQLTDQVEFDGLCYPSVAMKFKDDNIALFEKAVNDKLELVNTYFAAVGNMNFETANFVHGILHEANEINNGKITWSDELYRP